MARQQGDVRETSNEHAKAQRFAEADEQHPRTLTGRLRRRVKRLVGKHRKG
jgi:hypothetical protein